MDYQGYRNTGSRSSVLGPQPIDDKRAHMLSNALLVMFATSKDTIQKRVLIQSFEAHRI